jgi:hypothetical protein
MCARASNGSGAADTGAILCWSLQPTTVTVRTYYPPAGGSESTHIVWMPGIGGERAAAIYIIAQTAKLNGLNPEAYFRDILTRIADGHPINRIAELMPWRTTTPASAPSP